MRNIIIEKDLKFITFKGANIPISGANGFLPAYLVETILFLNENQFKNKTKFFFRDEKSFNKAARRFTCLI